MMNISLLTPEAVVALRKSPYVANVSEKVVRFTEEFKEKFWAKYQKGAAAPIILEQLGIDPAWLGKSRVAGIRQPIKKQARQIEGFKDHRLDQPGRAKLTRDKTNSDYVFDVKKRLRRLENETAYMQQKLEFVKKYCWQVWKRTDTRCDNKRQIRHHPRSGFMAG